MTSITGYISRGSTTAFCMRNKLLKKIRTLSQLLVVSGACNILMLALVIYWYAKERPPTPICEKKPASAHNTPIFQASISNQRVIQSFDGLTINEILNQLNHTTTLENGFTNRDLALGYLITELDFDSDRAFLDMAKPTQFRTIIYKDTKGKQKELKTYADLKDVHFLSAIAFGSKEKWPLTSQGLFLQLQQNTLPIDRTMRYAFYLTPEFMAVELLFKRSNKDILKEHLLQMLLEGSWPSLVQFAEYQRVSQDLSETQRQKLLMSYVIDGSPTAASLILKIDPGYAVKQLNDEDVTTILALSTQRTRDAAKFALTMLASPRSDGVWKAAATRLYQYTGEPIPQQFDKSSALKRFFPNLKDKQFTPPKIIEQPAIAKPQASSTPKPKPPLASAKITKKVWKRGYTVKQGDTLWKIGHLFSVDVKELKNYNNIHNEDLTPGSMIIVP
jgi:LysM domain